jgi:hypothetical protein
MKLLADLNREKEEAKRVKIMKDRVMVQFRKVESVLRAKTVNSFEKVYTSLAFQKIVEDLAIHYSIGKLEVYDEENFLRVDIINSSLTTTDLKNLLNIEKENFQLYNLMEAFKEIDKFEVKQNQEGTGIVVSLYKYFK